jgi:hypothetical protein
VFSSEKRLKSGVLACDREMDRSSSLQLKPGASWQNS